MIILANVPFEFIFVTFIFIFQSKFMVQPKHSLHFSLNTGMLSQVNMLSSIFADHVNIFQSRAIFSQAFTTIISHNLTSSISFSIIFNHHITYAFLAHNSKSFQIASQALVFALCSKYFHKF
ncbi:hypothetical protein HOB94_05750, partial [bacterium]|nr:hypothetical protein [bacterium]